MSLNQFWDEYELYFHHEFINLPDFPTCKIELLQKDIGSYFINKDFTIYQEKTHPKNEINSDDFHNNFTTFMRILYHLPTTKVKDFLQFHFDKYAGEKLNFLNFVYHEFKGSKSTKGGKELPPPQQKLILLKWCENKILELNPNVNRKKPISDKTFIHIERINNLKKLEYNRFDLKKLIKMLEEINDNYSLANFLSIAMLGRSIIDHIPPIFGFKTFNEVSNNYGAQSFKKNMNHLNISMRSIADNYLHGPIREKESLPNENQIDFSRELDVLLAEIIRLCYK